MGNDFLATPDLISPNPPAPTSTSPEPIPRRQGWRRTARRLLWRLTQAAAILALVFAVFAVITSYRYNVSVLESAQGLAKECCLATISAGVGIYDPSQTRHAKLHPDDASAVNWSEYTTIDQWLPFGKNVDITAHNQIKLIECRNERIIDSQRPFGYQPYDEPRLTQLRTKYGLDKLISSAATELDGMVAIRSWARSRFRRSDYQIETPNFDALAILDNDFRDHGENRTPKYLDPCHFFPQFLCELLVSVGHQTRLVRTADHGQVETWSNQFCKWILMDAELDHYFEKDGTPLNMVELLDESFAAKPTAVRIVRGKVDPNWENPTKVHLGLEELDVNNWLRLYQSPLHVIDMRNDWMTNHYFRGHPARSEKNSLVYVDSRVAQQIPFGERLRPRTSNKDEFNWTLNQAEIHVRKKVGEVVDLAFRTFTPNFAHFEIGVDEAKPIQSASSTYQWRLHEGKNTLCVRPVNQFGIQGIESKVTISLISASPGQR